MVAVRSRNTALAFAALMLTSTFVLVAPTAAASHLDITNLQGTLFLVGRDGAAVDPPQPAGSLASLKLGDEVRLVITFDSSSSCPTLPQAGTLTGFARADLRSLNSTLSAQTFVHRTADVPAFSGFFQFNISAGSPGVDGASTTIPITAVLACKTNGADQTVAPNDSSNITEAGNSAAFPMDNVAPAGTWSTTTAGSFGIADAVTLTVTRTGTATKFTLDMTQLGGTVATDVPFGASNTITLPQITITETNLENAVPIGSIVDAAGNIAALGGTAGRTFDTKRPLLTDATLTPKLGNATELTFTPSETDPTNLDVHNYSLTFTRTASGTPVATIECSKTPGAGCSHFAGVYNATQSALESNTLYTVTILAFDDAGNQATGILTKSVTTAPYLHAVAEHALAGNPPGRIGSVVNVQLRELSENVSRVTVDASAFGITTPLVWGTGGVPLSSNLTFTVASGEEAPILTAKAFGPTGNEIFETTIPVRGYNGAAAPAIDAKAPAAAGSFVLTAQSDGSVKVTFSAPADADVYGYNLTYRTATGTPTTVALASTATEHTVTGLTTGVTYNFSLVATDDVGNIGAAASGETIPTLDPIGVLFAAIPADNVFPTIHGTWHAVDGMSSGVATDTITVAVNDSAGNFWDGDGFDSATKVEFEATFTGTTTGTWTISEFTNIPSTEENGNFTFEVTIRHADLTPESVKMIWLHDLVVPEIDTSPASENDVTETAGGVMQGRPLLVNLNVNDSGGIKRVNFTIVFDATGNRPVTDLNGNLLTIFCPTDPRCQNSFAEGQKAFDGTVSLLFPNVPLTPGDATAYKINMTAEDVAGNKRADKTNPTAFSFAPRAVIAEGADTPSIATDGRLRFRAYAAWNGTEAYDNNGDPFGECVDRICRVAQIEFYLRAGTSGDGSLIGTEYIPVAGPDHSIDETSKYYNYTPSGSFPVSIDPNNAYVRAKAISRGSPATTSETAVFTPWVRVRTTGAPGGLNVLRPLADNGTFMPGNASATYFTNFSVALEQSGVTGTPVVSYSIFDETPGSASLGKYVYIHAAGLPATATPTMRVTNLTKTIGTTFYYNWTNNVTLAPGVYVLNVSATTTGGVQTTTRWFTVEDSPPSIVSLTSVSDIFENKYVRNEFNFTVRVNHGFAGLNSSSLRLSLVDSSGDVVEDDERVIVTTLQDDDGTLPAGESSFAVRVRLPADAADTSRYDMRLNLTTEAVTTCGCRIFSDVLAQPIILDAGAGNSGIYTDLTADTGNTLGSTLRVHGFATDAGTGIAKVQVRIVNLTGGSTWRPSTTSFASGIQDGEAFYVTAVLSTTTGPLLLTPQGRDGGGVDIVEWTLSGGPGNIRFDRGSQYFIDVRVTDKADFVSNWRNATVRFDDIAPTLADFEFTGGVSGVANTVDWHGAGKFRVNASDNACVGVVRLNVARSDGTYYASGNFTRPAAATCGTSTGDGVATWELDLANHTNVTDFVGTNRYTVEAFDPAGNRVGLSKVITLTVRDTTKPTVRWVFNEPSTVGVGLPATIVADIFENANISRVELKIAYVESPSQILGRGNFTARNVSSTGTGLWEARISNEADAHVNLSLERRDYVVSIRPIDVNSDVTCPNLSCEFFAVIMRVVEGAPPQIVARGPTGDVVNATPTFRYEVTDLGLNASGISIHTGVDGVFTEAPRSALNFTEILASNGTVLGQTVVFTPPTALADSPNFTVRVAVASTRTGFRSSLDSNFTVDGTPPTVSSNVTGTTPMNDRTYAVALTRVTLNATDNLTGPPSIRYTVNGGAEQTYTGPITPSGNDGEWELEFWARDAAGNLAPKHNVTLFLDRTGPRISANSHGDIVVLTVNDDGVGVNDSTVTVHYRYGAATSFTPVTAARVAGGNTFRAQLPGDANTTGLAYYFTALDDLGNQGTNYSAVTPYTIRPAGEEVPPPPENEPPTLEITAPTSGQQVSGAIDIKWTAADPDGETLTVVVARQSPNSVLMTPATDPGHFLWNVTGLPAGAVTIVVTASDGVHEVSQQVTFNVVPRQTIVPRPIPSTPIAPGASLPIEVAITPIDTTVERATYSLVRNGTPVGSGPLTRTPSGTYAAVVSANQTGVYVVVVDVVYGNSTTETRAIGQFAVQSAAPPPVTDEPRAAFPVSLMVLAALALLTVALAAYGAFGRWRK